MKQRDRSEDVGDRVTPPVRVAWALALLQLGLHAAAWASSADPRLLAPHGVALLHDLLILVAVLLVAHAACRRLPPNARRAAHLFFVLVLSGVGLLLSLYPQLLREYLAFPVNLFIARADSAAVLLHEYLGLGRLWPALAVIAVVAGALRLSAPAVRSNRLRRAAGAGIVAAAVLTIPGSPHPWVHSIMQSLSSIASGRQREVPSLESPPPRTAATIARRLPLDIPSAGAAPAHVFLIVLEGVTAADFEQEFQADPGGFHAAFRDRAMYFSRYYATNLDSYTSLIAMLTAVQVPYRAYAGEGLYAAVNDAGNVPRALRRAGYYAVFVSTYQDQPFVPTRGDWDRILDRSDLPTLDGWLSLGSNRMEAATEDRAALSTIVDLATRHDKTFVLHELVYGHSTQWRAAMGQSQLAYYDQYLRELSQALEERGLRDKSLFVIVSDHGDRARSSAAENYRVPLLIVGPAVMAANDAGFRSHLDLPRILAAVMGQRALPAARMSQYVVGSTERWVYGQLWPDGSNLFIDDAWGSVTARRGVADAASVQKSFQALVNAFGAEFGPWAP